MVVEKIEMPSRQARNFGERVVDGLSVETSTAFEKRVLVTKGTVMRTAA